MTEKKMCSLCVHSKLEGLCAKDGNSIWESKEPFKSRALTCPHYQRSATEDVVLETMLAQLSEFFDAVQILACRLEDGETYSVAQGFGLLHARIGLADEFLQRTQIRIDDDEIHGR